MARLRVIAWMHDPLLLLINVLATVRIERLIARDTFPPIARMRDAVLDSLNRDRRSTHWLDDLINCPWCLGWWCAVGVVLCATFVPYWTVLAVPLAFSAVIGHLVAREEPPSG